MGSAGFHILFALPITPPCRSVLYSAMWVHVPIFRFSAIQREVIVVSERNRAASATFTGWLVRSAAFAAGRARTHP